MKSNQAEVRSCKVIEAKNLDFISNPIYRHVVVKQIISRLISCPEIRVK